MFVCVDVKKWILWVLIVVKRLLLWFWKSFLILDILSWRLELSDLLADVERVTSSTETIWTVLQRFCSLFKIVIRLYPPWHIFTSCISACFFSDIDCLSPLVFCYDSRDYACSDQALVWFPVLIETSLFTLLYIFSLWALCSFCLIKIDQAMRLSLVFLNVYHCGFCLQFPFSIW